MDFLQEELSCCRVKAHLYSSGYRRAPEELLVLARARIITRKGSLGSQRASGSEKVAVGTSHGGGLLCFLCGFCVGGEKQLACYDSWGQLLTS